MAASSSTGCLQDDDLDGELLRLAIQRSLEAEGGDSDPSLLAARQLQERADAALAARLAAEDARPCRSGEQQYDPAAQPALIPAERLESPAHKQVTLGHVSLPKFPHDLTTRAIPTT